MSISENNKSLGIDYGEKRVGVAISDDHNNFAIPFCTIRNKSQEYLTRKLLEIIRSHKIKTVLIGVPLGVDGTETQMSDIISGFIEKIRYSVKEINLDVEIKEWNEVMTSYEAYENLMLKRNSHLKIKEKLDMESACIILQEFLDSIRSS